MNRFPGGSDSKESACHAGDLSIMVPELGRSPGERNGNSRYSCLENPMDRGAWWVAVPGVTRVGHDRGLSTAQVNE